MNHSLFYPIFFRCFRPSYICAIILSLYSYSLYAETIKTNSDDELQRINYRANKLEEKIVLSNLVYDEKKLTLYVNSIMAKLYPDLANIFRVKIYVSTEINAFVLPNGSVYLNIGLLAKAENEAQIAAILAHEGAHYIANHQLQKQQELKYIASGSDFFGYERTRSLISDYSKEIEQEADDMGFDSLVNAGYDTREAVRIFTLIAEQTKALNIRKPSLYSTHPKLVDRIKYFGQLSKGLSGYNGKQAYLKHTATIIIYNLQLNLSKYSYENILIGLENNNALLGRFPQTWFYLGEAYRQRGGESDSTHSEYAYLKAIEQRPSFAPSYRALGILLLKTQHTQEAAHYFEKYLSLAPHAQDRHYIEQYYELTQQRIQQK